jgi:hypothetical protein
LKQVMSLIPKNTSQIISLELNGTSAVLDCSWDKLGSAAWPDCLASLCKGRLSM